MIKNNNLTKGIFCILISAFGFALMSFFVKLSGDLPVLQKAFFRNLIAGSIALIPVIKTNNLVRYPREKKDWIILFFRSIFGTIGLICNFFAVSHINLADASIIQRLSPFVIIILSYFIFKEKVTKKQILFIFLAFFGVVLVIKPNFVTFMSIGALAGLGTAFFSGVAYTCVRYLGMRKVSPEFIVSFFSIFSCVSVAPFVIYHYVPMSLYQVLILILVGITGAVGQFGVTYAYRYAAARSISIFDYSQIIFAGILGFFIFNEIPDIYSLIGYFLIVLSGFFINFIRK
ncbi:DMT family transporter [Gemelliphila asaccharolytica]|uniref:Membrane protein n=1 Tax=Gemelliphila asaccharolytica TaxID=502393 RepID=A0ABR5TLQ4_9BACL|nr:DMT family transporter [Gemella asaccharolytica]KXB57982.1 putative membrane protein [Gemella asaccharolytica]